LTNENDIFISNCEELFRNSLTFEKGLHNEGDKKKYMALVKGGKCFLPYFNDKKGLFFAPSRFLGYKNNNIDIHIKNIAKDGRVTNKVINKILQYHPTGSSLFSSKFEEFLDKLGIQKDLTAIDKLKFWITPEVNIQINSEQCEQIQSGKKITGTEREQLIFARDGQGKFRNDLLTHWEGKCCLTGISLNEVLRASHIKPWRDSNDDERLDKFNCLLLSANLDALFDSGLISFDSKTGSILISKKINRHVQKALLLHKDMKINIDPNHAKYLEWHRKFIFSNY